jgi:hypothetical protein
MYTSRDSSWCFNAHDAASVPTEDLRPHWRSLAYTPVPRCGWLQAPTPRAEGAGHSRMPSEQRPLLRTSDVSCCGFCVDVKCAAVRHFCVAETARPILRCRQLGDGHLVLTMAFPGIAWSSQRRCGDPVQTESRARWKTSLERDRDSSVRNRISQCDVIGMGVVFDPRSRRLLERLADLLSRTADT